MNELSLKMGPMLALACRTYQLDKNGIHGPGHWLSVLDYGFALHNYEPQGVDMEIVTYFALLHDMARTRESHEAEHGGNAADIIETKAWIRKDLGPVRISKLVEAVRYHQDGETSDDPTIGTCWDADRLDLIRLGITPDPKFMSTEAGIYRAEKLNVIKMAGFS